MYITVRSCFEHTYEVCAKSKNVADLALTKLFLNTNSKSGGIGVEGEGKGVQRDKRKNVKNKRN